MKVLKDLLKKYWAGLVMILIGCAVLIYSCSYNSSNSLLKNTDQINKIKESTTMVINSSNEIDENNNKTIEVAEEYKGKQIPVAIIKTDIDDKIKSIDPIKREYEITTEITQSKDQISITPKVEIKQVDGGESIKIIGKTTTINKEQPNGLVRDFNLGASIGIGLINNGTKLNSDLGFVGAGSIGLDWLKWSQMRFLSPAISINTDKQIAIQLEPIKYNLYSNSFAGIYIDTNYKGDISTGIKLSVNL